MRHSYSGNERVTTALLLAAGTGSRLYPLTQTTPKCLTIVNGISILERMVSNLSRHGFKRLVIVTGYLENHLREFLGNKVSNIAIDYIFSPLYNTTNNIYSLWMARGAIKEPFLLLESDLVFDDSLLTEMLYPDRIAVAEVQPWMSGTCVTISKSKLVKKFFTNTSDSIGEVKYKTVNIYSISYTAWHRIIKKLDERISNGDVKNYYETIFAGMVADDSLFLDAVSFDSKPWYEIDTIEDLANAEILFPFDNSTPVRTVTLFKENYLNTPQINAVASL